MQNEILINATAGETRVAIIERGSFVDLHIERTSSRSVVGSVIKGRVKRVLPGMQAAFVDIGLEKAAFLYVGDYIDEDQRGSRDRRGGNRTTHIENVLDEGQEIVVQVAKEPIGTKGARITSNISIAGRHLVLTPWSGRVGVSRRIDGDRERRRLREIVERLRPKNLGFIIRTAGETAREADLEADVRYLASVWEEIEGQKSAADTPATLYAEPSLPIRVIRDFANSETKRIVVDSPAVFEQMSDFVSRFVADPKPKIELHEETTPIFRHYEVERQIDANLERKVWLKSGGYLIIDQTEALTSIDVNTGRYVGKRNLEETVLKTNLEAVREVAHQLRFRNIGGLIIMDLIDMEPAANREKVYRAAIDAMRGDKAKTNVLRISELGLIEMTRKRTRENLVQTLCEPCTYCDGRSFILSKESVAYKVLREIRSRLGGFSGRRVALSVNPRVAATLLGTEGATLKALAEELGHEIEVRAKTGMHQGQFEIVALDEGPAVVLSIPWLAETRVPKPVKRKRGGKPRSAREEESLEEPATSPEEPTPEAEEDINAASTVGETAENALHSAVPNDPEAESNGSTDETYEELDTDEGDDLGIEQFSEEHMKL